MNASMLVSLFTKHAVGPRCELVVGESVVTDFTVCPRWRVTQEDGAVEYLDSKPRYQAGKNGWPKVEQVSVVELKLGRAQAEKDGR